MGRASRGGSGSERNCAGQARNRGLQPAFIFLSRTFEGNRARAEARDYVPISRCGWNWETFTIQFAREPVVFSRIRAKLLFIVMYRVLPSGSPKAILVGPAPSCGVRMVPRCLPSGEMILTPRL